MISCDKGDIKLEGSVNELSADVSCIIQAFKLKVIKFIAQERGDSKAAEELLTRVLMNGLEDIEVDEDV